MHTFARLIPVVLLSTASAFAQADASEQQCQQQLESYLSLTRAPEQVDISGQNQVGPEQTDLNTLIETEGYCAAWQKLIASFMHQHGQILDSVEDMTGQPAPKR